MSDIAIEFRVKNARLKRAILATGANTYAEFCRKNHLNPNHLSALLSMRARAFNTYTGDWTPTAYAVSSAVHMEPEELWPAEMRAVALSQASGEFTLTLDEAAKISAPGHVDRLALQELMKSLRPAEVKAIAAFARGETLGHVGEGVGQHGGDVTRERARQITKRALLKMKRAAARKGIRFTDVIDGDAA
jgi:hypothetical protein